MFIKVYRLTCNEGFAEQMFEHYDTVVVPMVHAAANHSAETFAHQFIQTDDDKWMLIANYKSADAAEAGLPLVKEIVQPMAEKFGMTIEPIGAGEVVKAA